MNARLRDARQQTHMLLYTIEPEACGMALGAALHSPQSINTQSHLLVNQTGGRLLLNGLMFGAT